MAHVFISYSTKDIAYAERLEVDLESNDYIVWRDKSELRGGDEWVQRIKEALGEAWAVVLIQSPDSEKSDWVGEEIQFAENQRIPIVPILLRGDPWFGFLRKQYLDIRSNRDTRIPADLYLTLIRYAPSVSLDEELGINVLQSDTTQRIGLIPKLEVIARNPKSLRGVAARRMLEQLTHDSDEYVRNTAKTALRRLADIIGIRPENGSNKIVDTWRALSSKEVRQRMQDSQAGQGPSSNAAKILGVVVGILIVFGVVFSAWVILRIRNSVGSQIGALSTPTSAVTLIAEEPSKTPSVEPLSIGASDTPSELSPEPPSETPDKGHAFQLATVVDPILTPTPENTAEHTGSGDVPTATIKVLMKTTFDSSDAASAWEQGSGLTFQNKMAVLKGQDNYNTYLRHAISYDANGALILFKYSDGDAYLRILTGTLDAADYRELQITPNGAPTWQLSSIVEKSYNGLTTFQLHDNTWYYLLFKMGHDNVMYVQVWERDNPHEFALNYSQSVGNDWTGRQWQFDITAKGGTSAISEYSDVRFPDSYTMPDKPSDYQFQQ